MKLDEQVLFLHELPERVIIPLTTTITYVMYCLSKNR